MRDGNGRDVDDCRNVGDRTRIDGWIEKEGQWERRREEADDGEKEEAEL